MAQVHESTESTFCLNGSSVKCEMKGWEQLKKYHERKQKCYQFYGKIKSVPDQTDIKRPAFEIWQGQRGLYVLSYLLYI